LWVGAWIYVPAPFLCEGVLYITVKRTPHRKKWDPVLVTWKGSKRDPILAAKRIYKRGFDSMVVQVVFETSRMDGTDASYAWSVWRKVHGR
jgi:hypothetical protein